MYGYSDIEIMDAFKALLRENDGESRISIQQICRRANVNRQSFYYHFTDIADLVSETIRHDLDEAEKVSGPCRLPSKGCAMVMNYVRDNREMILRIRQSKYSGAMFTAFSERQARLIANIIRLIAEERQITLTESEFNLLCSMNNYTMMGFLQTYIDRNMREDPALLTSIFSKLLRASIVTMIDEILEERKDPALRKWSTE
ncbi:MAG: TetR/AcrR family transcriptional regulator [Anaerovoracaceae bacterium]